VSKFRVKTLAPKRAKFFWGDEGGLRLTNFGAGEGRWFKQCHTVDYGSHSTWGVLSFPGYWGEEAA
jgi:hypothetical protein